MATQDLRDWTGNSRSVHATLGANNYTLEEREINDYYATEPKAATLLMEVEQFSHMIWECACGEGHLAKEFEKAGYHVFASDLVNRGYGFAADFFSFPSPPLLEFDIVTNPPYSKGLEFVNHAMSIVAPDHKVAMFLKLQFLEGKARKELFKRWPPKTVYVSSGRLHCAKNGDFEKYAKSNAVSYAWFVWQKGYNNDPVIKWIN